MMKLSTGQPSTLGNYRVLCEAVFGRDSEQVRFINQKISESANGADEEVIVAESQMLYLLVNLLAPDTNVMEDLLR
jgi:hypothetical protein